MPLFERSFAPRGALVSTLLWGAALAAAGCASSLTSASHGARDSASNEITPPKASAAARKTSTTSVTTTAPLGFSTLENEVMYFVLLDRFANHRSDLADVDSTHADPGAFHGGDLEGLRAQLPKLKALGVTSIWVSPLTQQVNAAMPHVDDNGAPFRHRGFHGYWAERFDVIDPHFGDSDDLQNLLDDAHRLGLKVVLDVVLNHPGYGASYAKDMAWTRATDTASCDGQDERTQCLFGLPDFRTEKPEVAAAIIEWTARWAERFPFDGFRVDTLKHVEPALVASLHERVEAAFRRRQPDARRHFLMLGEWWGTTPRSDENRLIDDGVVDGLFEFSFQGLAAGFASGALSAKATGHHWRRFHEQSRHPLASFVTTHDTLPFPALVRQTAAAKGLAPPNDDDAALGVGMLLSTYGMPVLTYGDEALRDGEAWPHNRRCWSPLSPPGPREQQTRRWLKVRQENPGLRGRRFHVAEAIDDDRGSTLVVDRGAVRVVLHRGADRALLSTDHWQRLDADGAANEQKVWSPHAPLRLTHSQASMWTRAAPFAPGESR